MGTHLYGRGAAIANGRTPYDPKASTESTDIGVMLSKIPYVGFTPDATAIKSDTKPTVWTEPTKFKDRTEKMQTKAEKLAAVAKTGGLDALRTACRATANSSKARHGAFTSPQ